MGLSYDAYLAKVLPTLISYEHPMNMPEWFVPETYYYLWNEGHLVGEFRSFRQREQIVPAVMEALVYHLRKLVKKQGWVYDFTIFENETMRLLF